MDYNKFFQSRPFKGIVIGVVLLIVILFSFGAGMFVGYNKARFSYAWGENYERNFGGPHRGIFGFMPGDGFMNAHGTFGSVLNINVPSSTLIINGQDNIEKTVLVSSSTILREGRDAVQLSNLKVNDPVVVVGSPNDRGQIEAKLIRVLPPPPQSFPQFMPGMPK